MIHKFCEKSIFNILLFRNQKIFKPNNINMLYIDNLTNSSYCIEKESNMIDKVGFHNWYIRNYKYNEKTYSICSLSNSIIKNKI